MILAIYASTIRRLLHQANELKLTKEDIISFNKEGNEYVLIYNKK